MKNNKVLITGALFMIAAAAGLSVYAVNSAQQSELFFLKAIFIYLLLAGALALWLTALLYYALRDTAANIMARYDNIERILLDIRDGTKYFYREKRRSLRTKTDVTARFEDKTTGDDFVKIYDLSFDGALLRTTHLLRAGDTVKLKIFLPFFPQPISTKAKVTRVRPTKEVKGTSIVYEAGVEYTDMSAPDNEKLIETINILNRTPRKKTAS